MVIHQAGYRVVPKPFQLFFIRGEIFNGPLVPQDTSLKSAFLLASLEADPS
jgi:hypothetical protein